LTKKKVKKREAVSFSHANSRKRDLTRRVKKEKLRLKRTKPGEVDMVVGGSKRQMRG